MFEITGRLNLPVRNQTELLYKEDRAQDQTEADWLRKRCDALNFGRMPICPLPRRLEILLPNPALKVDAFRFTVIDLRGNPLSLLWKVTRSTRPARTSWVDVSG
jgi:hypothetical protein